MKSMHAAAGEVRTNEDDNGPLVGKYIAKSDLGAFTIEQLNIRGGFEYVCFDCWCAVVSRHVCGKNEACDISSQGTRKVRVFRLGDPPTPQRSMSQSIHDVDFLGDPSDGSGPPSNTDIPDSLQRATLRLSFPPSYVVVGAYRLLSDKALFIPIWKKCRNGSSRGAAVGCVWVWWRFSSVYPKS